MSMPNSEYWKQRFAQLENAQHDFGESAKQEISKMYDRAQAEIEAQIDKWYRKLAQNNSISMAEAQKWLKGKQLKEFKWDVGDYIEYGKENAMNKMWMKELENASAKFHISKLESLNISLEQSLQKLFTGVEDVTANTLSDCYKEGYYRTMYEFQKGFNVGFDVARINDPYIAKVLYKPWAEDGYNFSENIWKYKTKLINVVHNEITNNLLTGADPQKAIDVIAKKMSNSKFNAGRLVMTEEAYFSSLATGDCFNDLDVGKYEILATLDDRTSETCRNLDGKVFDMKFYQAGVTAPPFHCFCRSTTVPAFDNEYDITGSRAARDSDGKTYYVPGDMRYNDWKNAFVSGDKSEYDLMEIDGTAHYSHKSAPAPEPKPKKTYLTKKKLQANIADADEKIKELEKKLGSSDDKDIKAQIDALGQQKNEWQVKLDDKIAKEQKKELSKQITALEKEQAEIQKQIDEMEIKTYSGIWKEPVTTKDYPSLNIAGKKAYFEGKLSSGSLAEEKKKEFEQYLKQLEELEKEGAVYAETAAKLRKTQSALNKAESDLKILKNGGIIKADDIFSQERKDNALWFDSQNGGFNAADKYFDKLAKAVHGAATSAEHHGFYTYTSGSGGHNRPLAGFQKPWSKSGNGWEQEFYKGAKNVWIDFEGKGEDIRRLTDLVGKSSYDSDVWLQSGQGYGTVEGFLGIPYGTLSKMSDDQLQQFVGVKNRMYQFVSTAVNEGGGGCFNHEPLKINFYAPKGAQMLYASDVGAYGKSENEMILQRGGSYKITRMYWGIDETDYNKKKLFVDMEIHPEDGYDLFQQDPNEWKGSKSNYHS